MKKILSIVAMLLVALILVSCGGDETPEIVLITDKGDITDKSFNQGSYEGVIKFATDNKIAYGYIKPIDATTAHYVSAIEQAIADGAKVIVTPGFLFEEPINLVQKIIQTLNLFY